MEAIRDMTIQQLIEKDQGVGEILMDAGMHCLGCMMAHGETLEQACAVHGIDADGLIGQIEQRLAGK